MIRIKLTKQQISMVLDAIKKGEITPPIYMKGATFNAIFHNQTNQKK